MTQQGPTTHRLHVHGMHCTACVVLTENELHEHTKVLSAKSDLATRSVEICGDFGDMPLEEIAAELSGVLTKHGYTLSTQPEKKSIQWKEFSVAVPVAIGFVLLFVLLQKIGIVNLVNTGNVSYGTAFVIGIIASLSTCMAVVGGLVLSMSANFAKEGDQVRPQMLFHIGRLVSFFVLGGVIGAIGSAFQLGIIGTFILGLIIGAVMLILGFNLLDIFPWAKRLQPTIPAFIGKRVHGLQNINHTFTPVLVGVATFFLPCGFTQSMQIYTLTTGSFMTGALLMSAFALGTLPVLGLISFSSLGIHTKAQSGVFFKTAGLVVLFFALFNIINSFVVIGLIPPIFSF